jgi:hypothetical protein
MSTPVDSATRPTSEKTVVAGRDEYFAMDEKKVGDVLRVQMLFRVSRCRAEDVLGWLSVTEGDGENVLQEVHPKTAW